MLSVLAFGAMLLVTASAHWGRLRPDLIRMVPPAFPQPGLLVTLTGVFEILGAIGLQIPKLVPLVAICLALLLVLMFPANIYAAKEKLTIGGRPVPGLMPRIIVQISFFAALWYAGTGK